MIYRCSIGCASRLSTVILGPRRLSARYCWSRLLIGDTGVGSEASIMGTSIIARLVLLGWYVLWVDEVVDT